MLARWKSPRPSAVAVKKARRSRQLSERTIKYFFGGNAIVAVVVLALITIFLFREGFGFFGENQRNLTVYRTAGLDMSTSFAPKPSGIPS